MATYTYAQLEQLWINNGGPKSAAPVAAAVAEAESRGDSNAQNKLDNNGTQTSWGLWQISDGTHNQPVPGILDPNVNARAAVAKWKAAGGTFAKDWGTYISGAYTAYLSGNTPPDPNVPAATLTAASGGAGSPCVIGPVFGMCLLDKSQARAMIGGLMLTAGALIALPGIIVLVAAGFQRAGGAQAAGAVAAPLERTPGYGHAIRAVRTRSENRSARQSGFRSEQLRQQRAAGRKAARTAKP